MRTRNEKLPLGKQVMFRIGVNLGDVVVQGSDLLGDGVNVAARLQSSAEPGGVCISGSVYDQIQNKLALSFKSLGERSYKNISQPIRTFSILETTASVPTSAFVRKTIDAYKHYIAVASLIALLVAGWAYWRSGQSDDTSQLARRPASRDEIASLLVGKSASIGLHGIATYNRDGFYTYEMSATGAVSHGTYQIGDGNICIKLTNGRSRCDSILKDGASYVFVNEKGMVFAIRPK